MFKSIQRSALLYACTAGVLFTALPAAAQFLGDPRSPDYAYRERCFDRWGNPYVTSENLEFCAAMPTAAFSDPRRHPNNSSGGRADVFGSDVEIDTTTTTDDSDHMDRHHKKDKKHAKKDRHDKKDKKHAKHDKKRDHKRGHGGHNGHGGGNGGGDNDS